MRHVLDVIFPCRKDSEVGDKVIFFCLVSSFHNLAFINVGNIADGFAFMFYFIMLVF